MLTVVAASDQYLLVLGLDWTGEMHKFYWRNTHGPGARRTQDQTVYRMGKSGSADNILSEVNIIRVV